MKRLAKRYNAIVVGVGGAGSATVYELAKRGKRVLGLERYDIPHDMGSSHGYTRIIRLAYYEHPSYVMLLRRAYELWREIQAHVGEQLLHITGSIDAGPADSWVFKGSWQSCLEHNLPHDVLTGRELAERFPGYRLPFETMALFQPEGGYLTPERCIVSYVTAAQALGAEVHGREAVLDWVDGLLEPERQVLAWLQPTRPALFAPERFPVFNLLVNEGRYYGFPIVHVPGFKFGRYHHLEEVVDPNTLSREPTLEDEQLMREFAARYFSEGAGPTMSLKSCMFTNTPDHHFIIDLHPSYPQVSFTSPCSGHGYKFASVIGEVMADLAERGETRHNIELFRLDRFGRRARGTPRRRAATQPQTLIGLPGAYGLQPTSVLAAHDADAIWPFW